MRNTFLERRSVSLSESRIGGSKFGWARRERGPTSGVGYDLLTMQGERIAEEVINVDTYWKPRVELDEFEQRLMKRLGRVRKLFGFLRRHRHELFSEAFQDELCKMYRQTGAGKPPVNLGLMAMAMLLQGYMGVSDAEVVELTVMDLRWQLVLDCLGATQPALSQGAFQGFRERVIRNDLDLRLLERTVELARETGEFDWKKFPKSLREAADSSPFVGAGRVEDTINLLGHAARTVVTIVAALSNRSEKEVAKQAGAGLLNFSSIKKGLDLDWKDPEAVDEAVGRLAEEIDSLKDWVSQNVKPAEHPPAQVIDLKSALGTVRQVEEQDLETVSAEGKTPVVQIRKGVAKDRRVSIEDDEMRHGRKSSSKRFDGYKRHILKDLDSGLIRACAVTPANQPEADALAQMEEDQTRQDVEIGKLYIDAGYLASEVVGRLEARGGEVICRPWSTRNSSGGYDKTDFDIDLASMEISCPAGLTVPVKQLGQRVTFPGAACRACELRSKCTNRKGGRGRTVGVAEDEAFQQRLRQRSQTPEGRDELRERVAIEHGLAHIGQRQGPKARYCGVRKNVFDLRRVSAIQNLETVQRSLREGEYRRAA